MKVNFDSFQEFMSMESRIVNGFKVRTMYVDIVDDLVAGILLSQIIYWYSPQKSSDNKHANKLRVKRNGHMWIAKQRDEWYNEIRISTYQYDGAKERLIEQDLIEVKNLMFDGKKTQHIRLKEKNFLNAVKEYINKKDPKNADMTGSSKKPKTGLGKNHTPESEKTENGNKKAINPGMTGSSEKPKTGVGKNQKPVSDTSSNNKKQPMNADMTGSSKKPKTGVGKNHTPESEKTQNRSSKKPKTGNRKNQKPLTRSTTENTTKTTSKSSKDFNNKNNNGESVDNLTVDNLPEEIKDLFYDAFGKEPNNLFAKRMSQFNDDLLRETIIYCGERMLPVKYLNKVLQDCNQNNIRTREQFIEYLEAYQERQSMRSDAGQARYNNSNNRDNEPDSYEKALKQGYR